MVSNFKKSSVIVKEKGCSISGGKYSIINAADSSKIILNGNFRLGVALAKGSKQETLVALEDNSTLIINGLVQQCYDTEIQLFKNSTLEIGWSYINGGAQIRCMEHIKIGNQCLIARNVLIMDFDAHDIYYADGKKNNVTKPITIEDHVWLGAGSVVLKGVTIGKGAIVGAGSVVTRDVAPNTLVAGNPARLIKTGVRWE